MARPKQESSPAARQQAFPRNQGMMFQRRGANFGPREENHGIEPPRNDHHPLAPQLNTAPRPSSKQGQPAAPRGNKRTPPVEYKT